MNHLFYILFKKCIPLRILKQIYQICGKVSAITSTWYYFEPKKICIFLTYIYYICVQMFDQALNSNVMYIDKVELKSDHDRYC